MADYCTAVARPLAHAERERLLLGVQAWVRKLVNQSDVPVQDRDDAAQDCLMTVWSAMDRFDPARGAMSTFTGKVVRGVLAERTRQKSAPTIGMPDKFQPAAPDVAEADDNPAPDVAGILQAIGAPELLSELTESQRKLFELVAIEGLDLPRAAEQLGIKLSLAEISIRHVAERLKKSGKLPAGMIARFDMWKQQDAISPARKAFRRPRKAAEKPKSAEKPPVPEKVPATK